MARLKSDNQWTDLQVLLRGYGLIGSRLASVIGKCECTARSRVACPGNLTLRELSLIAKNGRVPVEKIMEAIKL